MASPSSDMGTGEKSSCRYTKHPAHLFESIIFSGLLHSPWIIQGFSPTCFVILKCKIRNPLGPRLKKYTRDGPTTYWLHPIDLHNLKNINNYLCQQMLSQNKMCWKKLTLIQINMIIKLWIENQTKITLAVAANNGLARL